MSYENERSGVPGRRKEDQWAIWDKRLRDVILFLLGVGLTLNEFLNISQGPRPAALVFLSSLIGLPFVLQANEKMRRESSFERTNDD